MEIDLLKGEVYIRNPRVPKAYQSQLSFWGFDQDSTDSDFVAKTDDEVRLVDKLVRFFDKENIPYILSSSAENAIKQIKNEVADFGDRKQGLKDFKDGKVDEARYSEFVNFITSTLKRKLKDHQKKAAFHLYLARNGANFSVPGSGKTSVVLSVYEKLRQEGVVDTLFVIGPPSSFGPWRAEFEATLGRVPKHQILAGGDRRSRALHYYPDTTTKSELYLTTFQTILRDHKEVINLFNSQHIKAFVVVDEAHYIKQLDGNWARAVLSVAKSAVVRCVLTGTPIPKSYTDIFNLFDFLWPNHSPIDINSKHRIQAYEKEKANEEARKLLDDTIGPLFYRVRKADLGLTEPVFHPPVKVKMNEYERKIYDAIENKIRAQDQLDDIYDIELVLKLRRGRMMRLRQATSYTRLLRTAVDGYQESLYDPNSDVAQYITRYDELEIPGKLKKLTEIIEEFRRKKEKVIIWSNFIDTIELIHSHFNKLGFKNKIIYGKTPIEQTSIEEEETREKIRNEFVDTNSGLDILIANPAACAESISLHTTCHNAVYYDLSFNCAQYLQSLDRIHRVGGSETTFAHYYFLQYEDTIDEDIKNSLDEKARKMYYLIDRDYSIYNLDLTSLDYGDEELNVYERRFRK